MNKIRQTPYRARDFRNVELDATITLFLDLFAGFASSFRPAEIQKGSPRVLINNPFDSLGHLSDLTACKINLAERYLLLVDS